MVALRIAALTAVTSTILIFAPSALAQRGAPVEHTATTIEAPVRIHPLSDALTALPPRFEDPQGPRPIILVTGYWPPTNEMLRRFSTNPDQNPDGWIGANWEDSGYDVMSYFPEFNPPNCSFCGRGMGDLEVDYQDTSNDFWRIVDELKPIAVVTFSRGFNNMSWEVEMNQYNRATWINDYLTPLQPTPAPPDDSVPPGTKRLSALPVQNIVDAVNNANLGLNAFICFSGDGGGFLSEFIAYHGVWYQDIYKSPANPDWCITAGHVHVGGQIDWPTATLAAQITIREVIAYTDEVRAATVVQEDIGFGGPGTARLVVAGDELTQGGTADLMLLDAPPETNLVLLGSRSFRPRSFLGGTIVPVPPDIRHFARTDLNGQYLYPDIEGGRGPFSLFVQAIYVDEAQQTGYGISNAVRIRFRP